MKTIELLKPLPIKRDEERHQYVNIETGQWLSYSTTGVCNQLTEEAKENIEKYRFMWQPRGEKVHECLAEKMLGSGEIDVDEYGAWVEPLLQHELFTHFQPMAVEHMMSIPDKSVGGQLDLLGYDTKTKQIRLIDLKTKGKYSYDIKKRFKDGMIHLEDLDMYWKEPYSTDKQLGCYVEMLKLNYDLVPDICNTIWAYEGRCILNNDQPTERCLTAWQEAWEKFEAKQELF
tara:strand:- start:511 stop:1203 length:693 start_codon:yes stop_codon:yes gene_type:complete